MLNCMEMHCFNKNNGRRDLKDALRNEEILLARQKLTDPFNNNVVILNSMLNYAFSHLLSNAKACCDVLIDLEMKHLVCRISYTSLFFPSLAFCNFLFYKICQHLLLQQSHSSIIALINSSTEIASLSLARRLF
jgi:hypothetical protein